MGRYLVVGAGAAGLACARALRRSGHEVEVFERDAAPGGRLRAPWLRPAAPAFGNEAPRPFAERLWAKLRGARPLDPFHPEGAAHLDEGHLGEVPARGPALAAAALAARCWRLDADPEELSAALAQLPPLPEVLEPAAQPEAGLRVRLGWQVVAVEPAAEGALVHYVTPSGARSRAADAVVMAVPAPLVPKLCAGLSPAENEFFAQVTYGRALRVRLDLLEPPSGLKAGDRPGSGPLRGTRVVEAGPGAGPLALEVAFASRAVDRLWHAEDDSVVASALDELERSGAGDLAPDASQVHRFDPMLPRFGTGSLRALAGFLRRRARARHLVFAGDYLVGPGVAGALCSGGRAANEVVRLSRRGHL